jgi:hypothetical protein
VRVPEIGECVPPSLMATTLIHNVPRSGFEGKTPDGISPG